VDFEEKTMTPSCKRQGLWLLAVSSLVLACSDDSNGRAGQSGSETGIGSATATESDSASGSASATESDSGSSDSAMSDSNASASGSAGDGVPKFDVAAPAGEGNCGDNGSGGLDFSYIWIANTSDSPNTVSKINTQTLVEEGRYQTRADGAGSPSRTSVALSGHAAVANRSGGVTKFYAYDCPGGQTSGGGPDSELPWDMEACRAWSVDFPYQTQRPVAWTPGTFNEETCQWEDEHVWSAGSQANDSSIDVLLLDGETGMTIQTVSVPQNCDDIYCAYGGAVDGDGNFWFSMLGESFIWKVDYQTFQATRYDGTGSISAYGIQVDYKGRPWLCGTGGNVARFTPGTMTWDYAAVTGGRMYGCMPDDTFLWVGSNTSPPNVRAVHLENMTTDLQWDLPMSDNNDIHGTSIDFDGNIWGVNRGTMAFRIDPMTGNYDIVTGLNSPYTYSDMTGFALSNVGGPQG
jgi:hypothetical protein